MQYKICSKCGLEKSLSDFAKSNSKSGFSNLCKDCHNISKREWAEANREKREISYKRHYEANKQKAVDAARRWKLKNPDKVKSSSAARYLKNRNSILEANKNWNKNNPIKMASYCAHRRAKIKSSGGRYTQNDIERIYKQQKGKCTACYLPLDNVYHIDHIIPINGGGTSNPENIQLLHPSCNLRKSAKHPIDFMQEMGYLI